MEQQNILSFLNAANYFRFDARKWNIINDNSKNNEVTKSGLCDYINTYILVKGDITVVAAPAMQVGFKNCAQFTTCIIKIETAIDDSKNLDLVMIMDNLLFCRIK